MLYASSQRAGAFVERLAPFRPDPLVSAGVGFVAGGGRGLPPGYVPITWLASQVMGEAVLTGEHAFVGHSRSLAFVRSSMAHRLAYFELAELDAATIRLSTPRRFTQEISRVVHDTTTRSGLQFAGLRYGSRLGDELDNWAIFESDPPSVRAARSYPIDADDPDFVEALELLGIRLV